jgi:ArsR family transcriptional regulator
MILSELDQRLKALADPTRLRILNLLMQGELCGCDIQYVLGLTQSNVSRHLAYLKHSGWVADRREGYRVFYGLADAARHWQPLLAFLRSMFQRDRLLRQDRARLRRAVGQGACQLRAEARPQDDAAEGARACSFRTSAMRSNA